MGLYMCIAGNGIPPTVNQTFNLEVHCKYNFNSDDIVIGICYKTVILLKTSYFEIYISKYLKLNNNPVKKL